MGILMLESVLGGKMGIGPRRYVCGRDLRREVVVVGLKSGRGAGGGDYSGEVAWLVGYEMSTRMERRQDDDHREMLFVFYLRRFLGLILHTHIPPRGVFRGWLLVE